MRLFRSARWLLMTLLLGIVPASSYAGVFISVGFAPPPLVVYEQPPCPEEGLMWTPGYWAYGPDGYYWVPGAWVPAPYEGALWTPGYWGYDSDLYVWHPGYWGQHVGYYGGVNYGFGYMGVGFVGGMWQEHHFRYNTAVVHVNNVYIHNTYIDRTVVERNTIVNDRHVAFSGGPGGIRHDPMPEERMAMHEQHLAPTSYQNQHVNSAMGDHSAYARFNGGRPQNAAVDLPLPREEHMGPTGTRPTGPDNFNNNRGGFNNNRDSSNRGGANPTYGQQNGQQNHPDFQNRQAPQQDHPAPQNEYHAAPQNQPRNDYRPSQQNENHPAPQGQPHNDSHSGSPQQSHPQHEHEHDKN
jgi:WXXGXW repeat (2 copies)